MFGMFTAMTEVWLPARPPAVRLRLQSSNMLLQLDIATSSVASQRKATGNGMSSQRATFLQFNRHAVQIDYILLRLPCIPAERLAKAWQESPIVHPTGLRHVPVVGFLNSSTNRIHRPHSPSPKAHEVHKALSSQPELVSSFRSKVRELLPHSSIEETLQQAWAHCSSRPDGALQSQHGERPRQSLKTFWEAKHDLRSMHSKLDQYWGPVVWYIAESGPAAALREFPGCARRLRQILQTWRSQIRFMREDKALRQRTRKSKLAQVNDLIAQAELSAPHGLQGLYRLSRKLAPKSSKKSIHFRHPDGSLMTDSEELASLTSYFRELYRADLRGHTAWTLQTSMNIGLDEVLDAFRQCHPERRCRPIRPLQCFGRRHSTNWPRVSVQISTVRSEPAHWRFLTLGTQPI